MEQKGTLKEGTPCKMSHHSSGNRRELCPIPTRQPAAQEKGTDPSILLAANMEFDENSHLFFGFQEPRGHFPGLLNAVLGEGQSLRDRPGDVKRNESVSRWKSPSPAVKAGSAPEPHTWGFSVTEITSTTQFPSRALGKGFKVTEDPQIQP